MSNLRLDELAYRLVANPLFDRVIIAIIITNCVFLGLYDPTKNSDDQATFIVIGDYVFSAIFIGELLVKWLALSVPAYFKDRWNWVDFIVVLESIVSLILKAVQSTNQLDVSALRALRVLRPLRAITYIQQVKMLFETVISAFKVVNTLLFYVGFALMFFGNVGYTYWAGVFDNTCINATSSEMLDVGLVCGNGYICPAGFTCTSRGTLAFMNSSSSNYNSLELNYGVTGYYDIWHAILQAFQVVSLDGWQQVMWHTQDAAGDVVWVYFAVLMILGNVMLISMFPAVISTKLEAAIGHEEERKRKELEQRKKRMGEDGQAKKGVPSSEFELLLNEYSKLEAEEIATIERLAAVRRGQVAQKHEEEPTPPPWTPLPRNLLANRLRKAIHLELGPFAILVYTVIFFNAFILCLDSANASERTETVLSQCNEAFTAFFVLEMVFKLGLLGPYAYFTDYYNIFDFTVTWLGLFEITFQVAGFFTALRVIRIFRIARVLRIATLDNLSRGNFNPSPQVDLARMVGIFMTSLPWIFNIYAVLLLLMYTFAVLGMQFFGTYLENSDVDGDNSITFNYNSFGKAVITLLDLLTGNLWSEVMFETVGATDQQASIVFYVLWLMLSRWLAVAMVVTVFFYRIDIDTEEYLKITARKSMRSVFALEHAFMQCHKSHVFYTWRRRYEEATGNRKSNKGQIKLVEYVPPAVQPGVWKRIQNSQRSLLVFGAQNPVRELCSWMTSPPLGEIVPRFQMLGSTPPVDRIASRINSLSGGNANTNRDTRGWGQGVRRYAERQVDSNCKHGERKFSCWDSFIFGESNVHRVARYSWEIVMTAAVCITAVGVSVDVELSTGRRSRADISSEWYVLEAIVLGILSLECSVLIISKGLVLLPEAYLRDPLNVVDILVTAVSFVCLLEFNEKRWDDSAVISLLRATRGLRVLRLVKVLCATRGLARVLEAIRSSGRALCLAGFITLFFWLQWSIVGLQVWAGTFSYCSDQDQAGENGVDDYYVYRTSENLIGGQEACEAALFEWKNPNWNFDSFGQALHSVLIIFTFNGWQKILFSAINARLAEPGLNAVAWNNTWAGLYFLLVLLSSLVLALLFVGVVFSMYTFLNLTHRGRRMTSLKQAFWTMYEAKLAHIQPDTVPARPGEGRMIRRFLFNVTTSPNWAIVMALLIGANVVVRFLYGSEWLHYREGPTWIHIQEAVFTAIFVVEWACRAYAFGGVRAVTRSPFQMADLFTTVVLALVFIDEISFLYQKQPANEFWKAVEAISMIRLVRLGHILPDVQELLLVTVKSSSVVFPLLLVMVILTYLWSVFGTALFGNDTYLADLFGRGNSWEAVNRHQGFFSVAQGMQTMLGVATTPASDGWVTLMQRYEDVTPGGWEWGVALFFTTYAFLTRFLGMNLFMMTLLFKYKTHSDDKVGVAMEQVNQFKRAWISHAFIYTKEYGSICAGQLVDLLKELPPPLGIGSEGSYYDCQILAKKVLSKLGMDLVKHVSARDLTTVLQLKTPNSNRKHNDMTIENLQQQIHQRFKMFQNLQNPEAILAQLGPGHLWLGFSQVMIAVHHIALFGVTLDKERSIMEARGRAGMNLSVLKFGVHRFLAMEAKRHMSPWEPSSNVVVAENSLLRTQLPATFMARSLMALTAEFLRWRDHVDIRGYNDEANMKGRCLLRVVIDELAAATATEKLTAKLFESHVGDRRLFRRLADIRQHIVSLKELAGKVDATRGEYLEAQWDGGSLRVRQTIDDGRKAAITAMCTSMDGEWIFTTIGNGMVTVYKRGKARKTEKGKRRKQGSFAQVQNFPVKGENTGISGTCVACSPDGFIVVIGCEDSTVRTFVQDTKGLKRRIQAMQAEGKRGPKPTVSYTLSSVGKGHRGVVKCVVWLDPGFFYTGGMDGTLCMWRKNSAEGPVQSVEISKSMFHADVVLCLALWRTGYGLDLLAACIELDDNQEIEPPVYLLAGDDRGFLWVLPSRTDRKFFAVDVWNPALKHQVQTQGGVSAVEAAWGRIYTASGSSGIIKVWNPHWRDERNEKLLGLEQVVQYVVHSGPVTSIKYSKGLMFSAGEDFSIVTWYPPHDTGAVLSSPSQSPTSNLTTEGDSTESVAEGHLGDGTRASAVLPPAPLHAHHERPEGGNDPSGDVNDGRTGETAGSLNQRHDPGFVMHVAGVIGLSIIPGGIISADSGGRLLMRGPDKLIESHSVQLLPSKEDIVQRTLSALQVLKTRGRAKRPGSQAAAATAVASSTVSGADTGAAIAGNGLESATAIVTTVLMPQATLDHLCSVRFLLRAKAKRRIREDMRIERQQSADLRAARIFAERISQRAPKRRRSPQLGAERLSKHGSITHSFKASRRKSILSGVCDVSAAGVSFSTESVASSQGQATADATKMVDMDQMPSFLVGADLQYLADHPQIYLAELMNHFFPCKDLARQHSGGRSATLTRGLSRETGTPTAARKGTPFRPFEMFGGRRRSSVAGADEEATAGFGAAMKFGAVASTAQASAAAAATALSNLQSLARRGRGSVVAHLHGIGERGARNNDRGDGEQSEEKHQEGDAVEQNFRSEEADDVKTELPNRGTMHQHARSGGVELGAWGPSDDRPAHNGRHATASALERYCVDVISQEKSGDPPSRSGSTNDSQDVVTAEDIGDNLSTVESRWRGNIVVHVPRIANTFPLDQPDALERGATGTWVGSVEYDGTRNISWVLAEALRMYERENPPLSRNVGLVRKPQLLPRPAGQGCFAVGGGPGATWVHDPPLPENAPVRSVLNPGEEVVVLVKGFNPALAFPSPRTQRSVCLPPPNRRKGASHESRDLRSKGSILRGMSDASIRPENALENIVENDPDSSAIARNTASAKRGKTAWGKKQTKKRSTETTGQAETSTSHSREDDMKEGTLFRSARRGQTSADETWYRGLFSNAMIRGAEVQQRLDVYPNNDDDDDDDDKNISHTHAVPLGAPTADTANDDDGEHRRARSTFEQTNNHPSAIGGKSLFQIDASSCDRKQHGAHKGFQQDRISNGIKARFRANDDDGDGYDEYGNDEDILTDEDESEEDRTIVSIPRPNNARPAARSAISISTDSSDSTRQREDSGTARGNGTVGGSIATSRRFSGNENVEQIRNTDRETEVEFSEPRSPPRSVISSIFAAWGNGRR